ncbi:YcbK family protein [Ramlibacter sp.]|uniref:YcbK family protein n=1 Tax=Ramlibacter sp. TaxID=1917967 RepID=UPI0039C959D0
MQSPEASARRSFLRRFAQAAMVGAAAPLAARTAWAVPANARSLAFDHTHTGEKLSIVYAVGERYLPEALQALNHFLRDHYTGDVGVIEPQLFDVLHRLRSALGANQSFQVISGYRCPATNASLKATRGGGVAKRSLHMDGKAIDIRLPGVQLADLRDAALSLKAGGVGFYQREQFVHVDTGRVRTW